MLDALNLLLTSPALLGFMLAAVPVGLFFGIVPGLGGKMAIVAFLPFVFTMDQLAGCVFLISLYAVVHTGGAVPGILFGIPGTGPSTAILLDGHAMTWWPKGLCSTCRPVTLSLYSNYLVRGYALSARMFHPQS